ARRKRSASPAARCTAGSSAMSSERRRKRKPRYERRIFALALLTGLHAVILGLVLLWSGDFAARTQWTVTILLVAVWLAFVGVVRERVVRPLQTISNMLAALREGDFSLRARGSDPDDALGLLLVEVNSLGEDLRAQRLGALGAATWHVSPGRAPPSAPRARRCESRAERGGAAGVATPHPRAEPRAQQLARPDQVDRPEPGGPGATRAAARRLARGSSQGVGRDRRTSRVAQPLDGGIRAAGAAAASQPRARAGRRVGAPGGRPGDAPAGHGLSRAGRDDSRRRRAARPVADQPGTQCGRCRARGRRSG